jgi:rubrerythrin
MDIFDYAIQMEKDGEAYYRELAKKSTDRGIRTILTLLADDEVEHRELFEALKKKKPFDLAQDTVLSEVKNIFVQMRESKEDIGAAKKQKELYEKARQLEDKSEAFYRKAAEETSDSKQKTLFIRLAAEEHHHAIVIDNLIEFITRPDPGNWLENAEWHHLDEY